MAHKNATAPTLEEILKSLNDSLDDFASKPAMHPTDRGSYGDFPLHKISIWGNVAAAEVLIDSGADVNALGEDNDTPLHRAIAGRHSPMVRLLISRGADPDLCNLYGNSAWDDAKTSQDVEILDALRHPERE